MIDPSNYHKCYYIFILFLFHSYTNDYDYYDYNYDYFLLLLFQFRFYFLYSIIIIIIILLLLGSLLLFFVLLIQVIHSRGVFFLFCSSYSIQLRLLLWFCLHIHIRIDQLYALYPMIFPFTTLFLFFLQ